MHRLPVLSVEQGMLFYCIDKSQSVIIIKEWKIF